jgi:hypothetical protein
VERVVLAEKYNQGRLAEIHKLTAQVFAAADPKKAAEFLASFMDDIFPELAGNKELTAEKKEKELAEFSKKTISLVPMPGGEDLFKLHIEEKK